MNKVINDIFCIIETQTSSLGFKHIYYREVEGYQIILPKYPEIDCFCYIDEGYFIVVSSFCGYEIAKETTERGAILEAEKLIKIGKISNALFKEQARLYNTSPRYAITPYFNLKEIMVVQPTDTELLNFAMLEMARQMTQKKK